MTRIALCSTSFIKNKELLELAKNQLSFAKEIKIGPKQKLSGSDLVDFLADVDAAIVGGESIDDALLTKCPKLKCISKYGVGLDNIDFAACSKHQVSVLHSPGVNSNAVAEHTIGLMLNLLHNIDRTHRKLRDGEWHKNGGNTLEGKKCLIVGCGHIGSKVALLLKQFGVELYICDVLNKQNFAKSIYAKQISYEEGLAIADIVSYHVPLDDNTKHLFHQKYFAHFTNKPWIINTSRGQVVHEESLIRALKQEVIRGAALDVLENEPLPQNTQLLDFNNIILTPHIAANSYETVVKMGKEAVFAIQKHFA